MTEAVFLDVKPNPQAAELTVIRGLVDLAQRMGCYVQCRLHRVLVTAKPGDSPIELLRLYRRERLRPGADIGRMAMVPAACRRQDHAMWLAIDPAWQDGVASDGGC